MKLCLLAVAALTPLVCSPAWAQGPAAGPAPGDRVLKLTNSSRSAISAVYASPAGSLDATDDLLGKQVAAVGKTVTLKVQDPKAACLFDLQFLMSNGDTITRKAVDLCKTADYTFTPGG